MNNQIRDMTIAAQVLDGRKLKHVAAENGISITRVTDITHEQCASHNFEKWKELTECGRSLTLLRHNKIEFYFRLMTAIENTRNQS